MLHSQSVPGTGQSAANSQLRRGQNVWRSRSASRLPPQSLVFFPGQAQGGWCCGQWHLGRRCGSCRQWGSWSCTRPAASGSCLHSCLSLQPVMGSGGGGGEDPGYRHEQACMCVWGRGLGAMPAWALLQSQVGPSTPCTDVLPLLGSSPPGSDGPSKGSSLLLSQSSACVSTALSLECFVWDTCQSAMGNPECDRVSFQVCGPRALRDAASLCVVDLQGFFNLGETFLVPQGTKVSRAPAALLVGRLLCEAGWGLGPRPHSHLVSDSTPESIISVWEPPGRAHLRGPGNVPC